MITTRCIMLCGGMNSRWKGYRNTHRKHLVEVEGELLLDRTLRLVAARAPTSTLVVVNKGDLNLYCSQLSIKTEFYGIDPFVPHQTEAQKFLSSKELWNPAGRTIVLLGDVWFSEEAISTIFGYTADDWTAFGRTGASRLTGYPYGELFAQSFTNYVEHEVNLVLLNSMYLAGICTRAASGWAHYQLMIGMDPNIHTVGARFVEIDDFTDDFDSPEDYNSWIQARSLCGECQDTTQFLENKATEGTNRKDDPIFPQPAMPYVAATPKIGRNDPCLCGSGKKFKKCCGQ